MLCAYWFFDWCVICKQGGNQLGLQKAVYFLHGPVHEQTHYIWSNRNERLTFWFWFSRPSKTAQNIFPDTGEILQQLPASPIILPSVDFRMSDNWWTRRSQFGDGQVHGNGVWKQILRFRWFITWWVEMALYVAEFSRNTGRLQDQRDSL